MSKRTTDTSMTTDEVTQLREVWERCGNSRTDAAAALGINRETFTRALAGLPILIMSAQYIRLSLPRTLSKLRRTQRVERTG